MNDYVALLIGILCAGVGGELFVRGTVDIASALAFPPPSLQPPSRHRNFSPELAVSITASLAGTPQIALGDALGSNVVNVALILALAILIKPLIARRPTIRRDFPVGSRSRSSSACCSSMETCPVSTGCC